MSVIQVCNWPVDFYLLFLKIGETFASFQSSGSVDPSFQRCRENQSQYGCERLSQFLEEPRRYVIRACSFVGLQVP